MQLLWIIVTKIFHIHIEDILEQFPNHTTTWLKNVSVQWGC